MAQAAPQCFGVNLEVLRDELCGVSCKQLMCTHALGFGHGTTAPNMLAASLRRQHTGSGPVGNERSLKLCEGRHDVKNQRTSGGCGVDVFGQRNELDLPLSQHLDQLDQFLN